ncbi:hypothetical protein [Oceanobacillus locisalsi]|uniref:Secreted protein n=1 Tax=Oceanobacillus locisalsi TaxID=546107 RepID=A0ABW3NNZ0_9BACI
MARKFVSGTFLGLALLMIATPALAAWHDSTITLPRNGWWYSVERDASGGTQQARVNSPEYDVVSNIDNGAGSNLSTNRTHASGDNTTVDHNTGVNAGTTLRGAFRSSLVNQFTNTVDLGWNP